MEDWYLMEMNVNTNSGKLNFLDTLRDTILAETEEGLNAAKKGEAFAELIQLLDDRSLSLMVRDAVDDRRKALKILRVHYTNLGKPRVIALYTELASLVKSSSESVTDYVIRADLKKRRRTVWMVTGAALAAVNHTVTEYTVSKEQIRQS